MSEHTTLSAALGSRREDAVRALVRAVMPNRPDIEQFALNRAAAALIDVAPGADPDRVVQHAARDAVALHLGAASPARPRAGLRRRSVCADVPAALAARAAGRLGPDDYARLARHLSRCGACAALESRIAAGDRAFDAAVGATSPGPGHASVEWLTDEHRGDDPLPVADAAEWGPPADQRQDTPAVAAPVASDDWLVAEPVPSEDEGADNWLVAGAAASIAATGAPDVVPEEWVPPGVPAGARVEDQTPAAASDEPGAPAEWLLGPVAAPGIDAVRDDGDDDETWAPEDAVLAPVPVRPTAAALAAPREPRPPLVRAAVVAALLLGTGGAVAASGILDSEDTRTTPPAAVVAAPITDAASAVDTSRDAADRRAARRQRRADARRTTAEKRALALRRRLKAAAAQRAAARRRVVSAAPVTRAPVQQQQQQQPAAAAQPVASRPKPTPTPTPSRTSTPSLPTPTATQSGPTGAAPSGEAGRTPPGT